jgi:biopolymer transport protein ExbD
MNRLLEVCLATILMAASPAPSVAWQLPDASYAPQALQTGISVRLPSTHNAVPIPAADRADSLIVSVIQNGSVFVGINPVSKATLEEPIRAGLSKKPGTRVYVKADADTMYANVVKVLDAIRGAGAESAVLLTGQQAEQLPGTPTPPYGLEVMVWPPSPSASHATVVRLVDRGEQGADVEIDNMPAFWANLKSTVERSLQNRKNKWVLVKAAGTLPYADIVHVADVCRSSGAQVALSVETR